MGRKKLKIEKYWHTDQCDEGDQPKNAILIKFNRPLHPLEAMGIVHLIQEDMENGK